MQPYHLVGTLLFILIFPNLIHSHILNSKLTASKVDYDSFENGIITKDIGKMVHYNSKYLFPFRIYHSSIYGQYSNLRTQFEALYELLDENKTSNLTNSLSSIILEELLEWKRDYGDSISLINNMFKWSLNPFKLHRKKRGLINGVAKISKIIFGTAEDKDVCEINNSMSKLLAKVKTQESQINLHTRIHNITTARISRIDIVQKKLVRLVNDLADRLEHFDNFSQIIETNMYNSNAFSSLILALMSLNSKTVIVKDGISEMMRGRLSPSLVDTKTLCYLLTLIKDSGHSLLIAENDALLSFYYNIAEVH